MRTEIDLIECEHFLRANLERSEVDPKWIDVCVNGRKGIAYMSQVSPVNRDDPCHENLSWVAKQDFNQFHNAFT